MSAANSGNNDHLRRKDLFEGDDDASLVALRDELIKFHSHYYSANQMSAVVMGRNSLPELREMVLPRLAKVVNKKLQMPKGGDVGSQNPPFRAEDLQKVVSHKA